jgi:hypothetical protein
MPAKPPSLQREKLIPSGVPDRYERWVSFLFLQNQISDPAILAESRLMTPVASSLGVLPTPMPLANLDRPVPSPNCPKSASFTNSSSIVNPSFVPC